MFQSTRAYFDRYPVPDPLAHALLMVYHTYASTEVL